MLYAGTEGCPRRSTMRFIRRSVARMCWQRRHNFDNSIYDLIVKPKFHHPALPKNASATPTATTRARSRRSAPAPVTHFISAPIITARSFRPGSAASRCRSSPHRLFLSKPEHFCQSHGSIPCTAACHRSSPAPTWPTGPGASASAFRRTATPPRSASAKSLNAVRRGVNMAYIVENNGRDGRARASSRRLQTAARSEARRNQQRQRDRPRRHRIAARRLSSRAPSRATRRSWCR